MNDALAMNEWEFSYEWMKLQLWMYDQHKL